MTLPLLNRVFPGGLDAHDPAIHREMRMEYEAWLDNQNGLQAREDAHLSWIRFVLETVLEYDEDFLCDDGETLNGWRKEFPEHEREAP